MPLAFVGHFGFIRIKWSAGNWSQISTGNITVNGYLHIPSLELEKEICAFHKCHLRQWFGNNKALDISKPARKSGCGENWRSGKSAQCSAE